jgi:hypothetical protein
MPSAKFSFKTKGKMFRWESLNGVGWYFVYIDTINSNKIREAHKDARIPRVAFGSLRVEVKVGTSVWKTSLFLTPRVILLNQVRKTEYICSQ